MPLITGTISDSAGAPANGWIEFTQVSRLVTGTALVTMATATAQVVDGTIRDLDGLPFTMPQNPDGTAVRVLERLGGRTYEWWTQIPATDVEYRSLVAMEPVDSPQYAPPPWLADVINARDETIAAASRAQEAADDAAQTISDMDAAMSSAVVDAFASDPVKTQMSVAVAGPIPTGRPVTPAQAERVITTFQAGHGWTVTGAASVDLNCIDTPAMGSQFLRVTTQPTGGAIADSGVLAQAVDARARAFRITFRVPAFLDLSTAYLFAGDNTMANYYQFRFMNGESDGGFQYTRGGEWATITLNWGDATIGGTPDRSKITRFRLSSVGNNKNLQIDFNELSIVPEQSIFPKGVVTFCFDDNHSSVQTYGVPILSKYQVPATIFTIAELVGTPDFMTLDQLKDVERRLGWEVAAHAYTNATHVAGYTNLTSSAALRDMQQIRDWLTTNGFKGSQHLAFPHGYYDKNVLQIAKNVFRTARGTVRRTHFETLPMGDPYRVRCIEVFNTDTVAFVKGEIDKAVANRSWLTLLFHILSTPASAQTSWTPADFEEVVAYATASGVALRTYGDAVDQGTQKPTPTKTNTRVSASSSSSYTVPDSTVKSNVPGAAVSFDSNGTSDVHTIRVGADITSLGGTAILVVTVLIDGVSTLVGALNVEDAARRRDRRNYTWESVTGLGPGTHNAQVQVALVAAGATGGFTINSLATISAESPPAR